MLYINYFSSQSFGSKDPTPANATFLVDYKMFLPFIILKVLEKCWKCLHTFKWHFANFDRLFYRKANFEGRWKSYRVAKINRPYFHKTNCYTCPILALFLT